MKILLVEDEPKLLKALARGLSQDGFAVETATNGEDGLTEALNTNFDIIILDRMLPKMDGLSIVKAIREAHINTPVIFLTAKDTIGDKVDGLDAGADDYLVKPFAYKELQARLRALARRPSRTNQPVLRYQSLSLDPSSGQVMVGPKNVSLSNKETALLEYMLRSPGQVFSKTQIMEHVWSFDADILPNTVEVYVGYLRKKIDKPNKTNYIQTIRGFGYRLGAGL